MPSIKWDLKSPSMKQPSTSSGMNICSCLNRYPVSLPCRIGISNCCVIIKSSRIVSTPFPGISATTPTRAARKSVSAVRLNGRLPMENLTQPKKPVSTRTAASNTGSFGHRPLSTIRAMLLPPWKSLTTFQNGGNSKSIWKSRNRNIMLSSATYPIRCLYSTSRPSRSWTVT